MSKKKKRIKLIKILNDTIKMPEKSGKSQKVLPLNFDIYLLGIVVNRDIKFLIFKMIVEQVQSKVLMGVVLAESFKRNRSDPMPKVSGLRSAF